MSKLNYEYRIGEKEMRKGTLKLNYVEFSDVQFDTEVQSQVHILQVN